MPATAKEKPAPHWYKITHYECPVCWQGYTIRERQYTKKPKDIEQRVEWQERYDHCLEDDCY